MKNYLKARVALVFGIIAIMAMIGFMSSCVVEVNEEPPAAEDNTPADTSLSHPYRLTVAPTSSDGASEEDWYHGTLRVSKGKIYFSFLVRNSQQYNIYTWDFYNPPSDDVAGKKMDVALSGRYSDMTAWEWEDLEHFTDSSAGTGKPPASKDPLKTFTATKNGTYVVELKASPVRLLILGGSATGTFGIKVTGPADEAVEISASPGGGAVASGDDVTLTVTPAGTDIFYTTNGTAPNANSTKYTTPIEITTNTTLRAFASTPGYIDGVLTEIYVIGAPNGTEKQPYPLTEGIWTDFDEDLEDFGFDGEIKAVGVRTDLTTGALWFSLSVSQGTTYTFWWDDNYQEGSGSSTADICVAAKYQGVTTWIFGGPGQAGNSSSQRGVDIGYTNVERPNSTFTATRSGTVLIRVLAETANAVGTNQRSGDVPGTFGLVYTEWTNGQSNKPSIKY